MCYAASISQLEYLRASWMKIYSQSYLQNLVKTWFENLSQFDLHQCKYHNSLLNNSYPNSLIITFQMENSHKKYRKRKQQTHTHTLNMYPCNPIIQRCYTSWLLAMFPLVRSYLSLTVSSVTRWCLAVWNGLRRCYSSSTGKLCIVT